MESRLLAPVIVGRSMQARGKSPMRRLTVSNTSNESVPTSVTCPAVLLLHVDRRSMALPTSKPLILIALILSVFFMHELGAVIAPFFAALVLSLVANPIVKWAERPRAATWLAISVVAGIFLGVLG